MVFGIIIGQMFAIVASILLAFSINAWWVEYQEVEEANRLLGVFSSEISDNIERLERTQRFRKAKRSAAIAILEHIRAEEADGVSISQLDEHLNDLTWWSHTRFATGALDAITQSGKLAWIESDEIREKVASWQDEIDFLHTIERQDYDQYQQKLLPYLSERTFLVQIAGAGSDRPGNPETVTSSTIRVDVCSTFPDRRLKGRNVVASDEQDF